MTPPIIANLERLLGGPRDTALLRFSLGSELLKAGDAARAVGHLREAVTRDPEYSAAWKLLGKALADANRPGEALEAYRAGIPVAERRGDKQAAKEMSVFARRLEKTIATDTGPVT
ncbi:MAG: tetratricopeptide repeat protein [Gammaproteobacteria bacterium]|nr:tetratricopeptide repeat protein [Gammaproteobacteria bacterium]